MDNQDNSHLKNHPCPRELLETRTCQTVHFSPSNIFYDQRDTPLRLRHLPPQTCHGSTVPQFRPVRFFILEIVQYNATQLCLRSFFRKSLRILRPAKGGSL